MQPVRRNRYVTRIIDIKTVRDGLARLVVSGELTFDEAKRVESAVRDSLSRIVHATTRQVIDEKNLQNMIKQVLRERENLKQAEPLGEPPRS